MYVWRSIYSLMENTIRVTDIQKDSQIIFVSVLYHKLKGNIRNSSLKAGHSLVRSYTKAVIKMFVS